MIKLRYADYPIFTKLDEIDNKSCYCVIDTSINKNCQTLSTKTLKKNYIFNVLVVQKIG